MEGVAERNEIGPQKPMLRTSRSESVALPTSVGSGSSRLTL